MNKGRLHVSETASWSPTPLPCPGMLRCKLCVVAVPWLSKPAGEQVHARCLCSVEGLSFLCQYSCAWLLLAQGMDQTFNYECVLFMRVCSVLWTGRSLSESFVILDQLYILQAASQSPSAYEIFSLCSLLGLAATSPSHSWVENLVWYLMACPMSDKEPW